MTASLLLLFAVKYMYYNVKLALQNRKLGVAKWLGRWAGSYPKHVFILVTNVLPVSSKLDY